jgi:hypothetical protein
MDTEVVGSSPTDLNFFGYEIGLPNDHHAWDTEKGPGSASSTWREGGTGNNFKAMNEANCHAVTAIFIAASGSSLFAKDPGQATVIGNIPTQHS